MRVRVGVVVPARNEAKTIKYTLRSLFRQELKPEIVVVVDDASSDGTAEVAEREGAVVVRLKRGFQASATGTPYLAYVVNKGLSVLKNLDLDFVMISGAEAVYPSNYIGEIVNRMVKERVIVASGVAAGEKTRGSLAVRGSGRLINAIWFKKIGFAYPLAYGFETWLLAKALSHGLKVAVYPVKFYLLRKTSMNVQKAYFYGKGVRALGYSIFFVLGRAFTLFMPSKDKNILAYFIKGYIENGLTYDEEIRKIVVYLQAKRLLSLRYHVI
jgi:glycosyltransferase involved in cell wall biosynthesis